MRCRLLWRKQGHINPQHNYPLTNFSPMYYHLSSNLLTRHIQQGLWQCAFNLCETDTDLAHRITFQDSFFPTSLHACILYQAPFSLVQKILQIAPETTTVMNSEHWIPLFHACMVRPRIDDHEEIYMVILNQTPIQTMLASERDGMLLTYPSHYCSGMIICAIRGFMVEAILKRIPIEYYPILCQATLPYALDKWMKYCNQAYCYGQDHVGRTVVDCHPTVKLLLQLILQHMNIEDETKVGHNNELLLMIQFCFYHPMAGDNALQYCIVTLLGFHCSLVRDVDSQKNTPLFYALTLLTRIQPKNNNPTLFLNLIQSLVASYPQACSLDNAQRKSPLQILLECKFMWNSYSNAMNDLATQIFASHPLALWSLDHVSDGLLPFVLAKIQHLLLSKNAKACLQDIWQVLSMKLEIIMCHE